MNIFDTGRVCVKLAGRDAGKRCVIVECLDSQFVLVDGETRRRKVNVKHLEPLEEVLDIKPGISHEQLHAVFEKRGWNVWDTKPKNAAARPQQKRKVAVKDTSKSKEKKATKLKGKEVEASAKNEESPALAALEKPKKIKAKKEE